MESPFQSYLDTNYVPSASDKVAIEQLLQGTVHEVGDIDAEIEALRQRLDALSAKKEERERFIARHCALLNPVRALPDEILCAIFDRCMPARHPFPGPGKPTAHFMSAEEAPMLLTFVCQRWRQIAVDHSFLWNEPHIYVPLPLQNANRWNEMARSTARIAQLWISRAKDRPLKLTIMSSAGRFPEAGLQAISEVVAAHSTRWQILELQVTDELLDAILRLPAQSFPKLQLVHLSMFFHDTPDVSTLHTGDNLLGGPSLTNVLIQGRCFPPREDIRFVTLPFRWCQLTMFWIPTVMLADLEVIEILGKAPSLTRCCFFISDCKLEEPLPPKLRVTAANLTDLQLVSHCKTTYLLQSLSLPRLANTSLVSVGDEEALSALVQSCSGRLQSLALACLVKSTARVIQALSLTPELESLTLISLPGGDRRAGPHLTDELLEALTPPREGPPSGDLPCSSSQACEDITSQPERSPAFLCPKLRSVKFHVTTLQRLSDSAILQFIKGRRTLQHCVLRDVTVMHDMHNAEMDVVSELRKDGVDLGGMDITLQYRTLAGS